jgi:hypothetical protein
MTTHTVTLNLPEAIYQRLKQRSQQAQRSLEDELLAVLVTKIPTTETLQDSPLAYTEIVEFLGHGATAQEIAEFRLSQTAQNRAQSLLQKNKEGLLSPAEEAELELYVELENFMALIKIQALQQSQNSS